MSNHREPAIRRVDRAAERCFKRTQVASLGYRLLLVNVAVFIASDVVGIVEFSLPTIQVDARVTEVESFGPWHHRTGFTYATPTRSRQHESSWSTSHPDLEVGQQVVAEIQESDFEHARVIGQRKGMIALWQTGVIPGVSLLCLLFATLVGLKRVRLAQRGTLVEARVSRNALVFDILQPNPDAGYRDQGDERTEVRIPIPKNLSHLQDGQLQALVYDPGEPKRALVLQSFEVVVDASGLSAKPQPRSVRRALFVLVPYVAFSLLLLGYYASN